MGFTKTKCWIASCDNCDTEFDECADFITHFDTQKDAKEELELNEWLVKGRKVYCPECVIKLKLNEPKYDGGKDNM